ncbi:MAG TPA: CHRD domain-containing protein, partial [Candidatus Saccharimonadales bacterium]|nr:CHRD domain-containing protein [Candidatus Saccharimonadales bacterium]
CGIASFSCAPPSGSTFPLGTTTVTCIAADTVGNSNSCSFTITVQNANEPPVCRLAIPCALTFPNDPTAYALAISDAGACVVFDGSGSSDPDGDSLSYRWNFDGSFPVRMDASQEPGGSGGTGTGNGSITLSGTTLSVSIAFSGLSANSTATHIHGPAPRGVNAAVLYPLNSIATLGSTAGTISGNVSLVNGTGGFSVAQQLQQLQDGLWYVNIHSTVHSGGEIRGQLDLAELSGATVTNCLVLGCHTVSLTVSDGKGGVSNCQTNVCVISAGEAVEQCISLVESTDVARKNKRPLIATLKAAAASFERGNFGAGLNQLHAFQNKVRAQIAPSNPAAADAFIACSQAIIDAVDCTASLAIAP